MKKKVEPSSIVWNGEICFPIMFVLVRGRKRELFHVTCKGGRGIASRERERERKNRFLQRCAVLCSVLCREISALLDHHDPIITFSVASSCFLLLVTETKGGNCTFLRLSFPWEVRDSIAEGLETLPKEWNELPFLLFSFLFLRSKLVRLNPVWMVL